MTPTSLLKQISFKPPYCPCEKCPFHNPKYTADSLKPFYYNNGWAKPKSRSHRVRKYICKHCGKNFQYTTFKLEYRERKLDLNFEIFRLKYMGVTLREIGRQLKCSEFLIRARLKKMAQQGALIHTEFLQKMKIDEPLAFDGLENFSGTQYDPNNINQAIGSKSLFIYDFGFAPLNRKGKMSPDQVAKNQVLKKTKGRYSPQAIRKNTADVIHRVYNLRKDPEKPLILYTDFHPQYQKAIQINLKDLHIKHIKISSKAARNFQNILFPVNHSDLIIRQHVGSFRRETIAFAKTPQSMVWHFILFMVWKNYFRFQFVKEHLRRPQAHLTTPAMHLNLTTHPLTFDEFFDIKRTPAQVPLSPEWLAFYHGDLTFKRELPQAA